MDDVHLEESSTPKESAIVPAFAPQCSKSESTAFESTRTSLNEQSFLVDHARGQSYRTYAKLWEQAAHRITPGYIQAKRAEWRAKGKGVPKKARIEQYRFATSQLVRQNQLTQTAIAHAAVKSIYSVDLEITPQICWAITPQLPRNYPAITPQLPRKSAGRKYTQNFSR